MKTEQVSSQWHDFQESSTLDWARYKKKPQKTSIFLPEQHRKTVKPRRSTNGSVLKKKVIFKIQGEKHDEGQDDG